MLSKGKRIHKYRVVQELGESNYATIYKVTSNARKNLVLKIARKKTHEHNDLIEREYQILSQFKHPNIVPVYDYDVTDDGRAYFTLEYVSGKPINSCFDALSDDFIAAVIQVINGLGAFHNKGFIHSDLKPEHILYDQKEKKAVLIDFGFAQARLAKTDMKPQDMELAGTIGYMAPEVIKGIGIDQRSDIYSLGVIIYETLAGKKLKDPFVPIQQVPEEINNMLARLVSKEPAIRPTIPELYQVLSKYLKSIKIEIPLYEVRLPNTGFVEMPEITDELLTAAGKAIVINGDTGTGKTRLLQEIRFKYLVKGYSVLSYASHGLFNLLESLEGFVSSKKIVFSNKEDLSADAQAGLSATAQAGLSATAQAGKFQVFEELNEALIAFAEQKKTVIIVDDLDCLSDYELGLFRYIGYGIHDSNILIIGASITDSRIKNLGFETIKLNPFTLDQTQELLEKTFFKLEPIERKSTVPKDRRFTKWLYKQSGGTPLFIVEILKNLYENKVMYYKANKWLVQMDILDKTKIPSRIEDLLEEQLKNLEKAELTILKILALAQHALEPGIISSVLDTKSDTGIERLKSLGLLKEETVNNRRVVITANQIFALIIARLIEDNEEQRLCNMLIKVLEPTLSEHENYVSVLAELSDKVKNPEKAYKYSRKSAENAESIYDYTSAVKYYEKMAEYAQLTRSPKYPEILMRIAQISQKTADNKTALQYYNKALKLDDKRLWSKIYLGLGKVYSGMGKHTEAIKNLRKAINLIENKETPGYIAAANRLAYSLMSSSNFKEAESILDQSLILSKKINNVEMTAETLYYQAVYEWFKGNYDKGIEKAQEAFEFTQENKLIKQSAYMANLLSSLYQQKNDLNQAQKYQEQAIQIFKTTKRNNALASALNNQASLFQWRGYFSKARDLCENALVLAQQTDNHTIQCICLSNLADMSRNSGRFDEAIRYYEKALELDPNDEPAACELSMIYRRKNEIDKASTILKKAIVREESPWFYIGLALINLSLGKEKHATDMLIKGMNQIKKNNPDISTKISLFLKTSQFYYENRNFGKSMNFSEKVIELTYSLSREYVMASAFVKIDRFNLKETESLDIEKETKRLRKIGCIYDYAYLKKLEIESKIDKGIKPEQISEIAHELNKVQEIFASLGANLELNRAKKIQEKLFPIIVKDYSQRTISEQYLKTFSELAELISAHLGDKNFIQNTLDLILQATNAERGALFIKASEEMEFIAGRNIDHTTIKDAGELSKTAIKKISQNKIVFTEDAISDPQFNIKKSVILNQIRSLLCIPLSVSDKVIGAIYLDSRLFSGIFGPQDKDFLITIAKILASVIEKSLAFRALTEANILLKSTMIQDIGAGYIIGKSDSMQKVYQLIESVSQTNSPVVILGETGTGKGMLARLIHLKSKRQNKRFLTINCGTIPETLLESELFGHKKGAFTGAVSDKKGLLEEGEAGTVFLDEITNTSISFQAKLLEAIEDKIIRRIGETQTRKIDVRFFFATNRDLEIEVEETRFRKDLFYRINVFSIEVPPLRERICDIPELAQFFMEKYSKEINKPLKGFTSDSMQKLKAYLWPGNVRELQNVIERAVVLAKEQLITIYDLGFEKVKGAEIMSLKDIRKEAIIEALNATGWNIKKTAELLMIGRTSIYRYMEMYNITK